MQGSQMAPKFLPKVACILIWITLLTCPCSWLDAQDSSQRVLVNSNNGKEEILFLDANDQINRSVCLFPRDASPENKYRISSSSETALKDFNEDELFDAVRFLIEEKHVSVTGEDRVSGPLCIECTRRQTDDKWTMQTYRHIFITPLY